jgi:2-oxoglutarate dehydrogenase E1 component
LTIFSKLMGVGRMSDPKEHVFEENPSLVERCFEVFRRDPSMVSPHWRSWFDGFRSGFVTSASLGSMTPVAMQRVDADALVESGVARLAESYKRYGHLRAAVNPLGLYRIDVSALDRANHGLADTAGDVVVSADPLLGLPAQTVDARVAALEGLFCGSVAPEFEQVENLDEKAWLYSQIMRLKAKVDGDEASAIFRELAFADAFEKTLSTKYIGKKRFSIEGADAQIPALETLLDVAARHGVRECMMGMAHRGRLAIIVGVVKMPFSMMLAEFEGEIPDNACCDDVKYHCGFESRRTTRSGHSIEVKMVSNPSHLEAVDPVLMGEARAHQDRLDGGETGRVLPVLLHGDAAISGQGVVYETLQMANLPGYSVGGIVHLVANNQLGFTTDPEYSRSSTSCTDIAKVIGAPIVHVNGEDLDAVHQVMTVALEYRQKFGKDFFVDLVCYRRHGHNEADEPTYTQPALYKLIKEKRPAWMIWRDALIARDVTPSGAAFYDAAYAAIRSELDGVYLAMKEGKTAVPEDAWTTSCGQPSKLDSVLLPAETAVPLAELKRVGRELLRFAPDAKPHTKLARRLLADRAQMVEGALPVDWGFAENLAYGTLITEGNSFRLSGQDVGRGTFSHRHAVFVDEVTGEHHVPLLNLRRADLGVAQSVAVVNSPLSEFAVLGFEHGYARNHPKSLTVWEAQFGDFVNGAQIILDQFLAAGECKWHRINNLVMLLPHGFEGQGAEHSSGRLERFMQLASDGNMIVANVTSSAQLFHLLRRQLHGGAQKPLVLFTPKSYLRSPLTASTLDELAAGRFEEVLDDAVAARDPSRVTRLVLCSGKVALDAIGLRAGEGAAASPSAAGFDATAIIRIEQLYPLQAEKLKVILARYPNATRLFWAQEEPRNMGAWYHIAPEIEKVARSIGRAVRPEYIGRHAKSSPAGGLEKIHKAEQGELLRSLFEATEGCEV